MLESAYPDALPAQTRLHWYVLERVLGQGGFGITYLARDCNLEQLVAVKEYLPVEVATRRNDATIQSRTESQRERYRSGLDRFIREARTLARFDHPNIVRVHSVFESNNTAYMVMRFEEGENLAAFLDERGTLAEDDLLRILSPVLDGLELVHSAGFIHRDIKPENIQIRRDGGPVLLDFGSARHAVGTSRTLTILVAPGYAPFEQYYSNADSQGPWTDIYSLGATCYRAIAGRPPTDAITRSKGVLGTTRDLMVSASVIGSGRYSGRLLAAIDHALAFAEKDRPQSVAQWRQELFGEEPPGFIAPTEQRPESAHPIQDPAPAATAAPGAPSELPAAPAANPRAPLRGPDTKAASPSRRLPALTMIAVIALTTATLTGIVTAYLLRPAPAPAASATTADGMKGKPIPEPLPTADIKPPEQPVTVEPPRRDPAIRKADLRKTTSEGKKPVAPAIVDPPPRDPPVLAPVATAPPPPAPSTADARALIAKGQVAEGVDMLRKLAAQSDADASFELGGLLQQGKALERNDIEAYRAFERAAALGHAGAMAALGDARASGRGVAKDDSLAFDWYHSAAEKGQIAAQIRLADRYASGLGVRENNYLAYVWYQVAARGGNEGAKEGARKMIERLQPVEVQQGNRHSEKLIKAMPAP